MPDRSGRESDVSRWSYLILVVVEAGENVSDQSWVACDTCLVSQREMPTAGFLSASSRVFRSQRHVAFKLEGHSLPNDICTY